MQYLFEQRISVHPRFAGDSENRYFVSPLDTLISEMKPKLWLHGHVHDRFDYTIAQTRVVANPSGYPKERAIAPVKIIEV